MTQVYGTPRKALVHEKLGDGIISAINFELDNKKVDDLEGIRCVFYSDLSFECELLRQKLRDQADHLLLNHRPWPSLFSIPANHAITR
ncbi:hypothetical protein HX870_15195 [Pseudomonas gingeri]|nr:hypothetical protein [Pseudomonas gingeri]